MPWEAAADELITQVPCDPPATSPQDHPQLPPLVMPKHVLSSELEFLVKAFPILLLTSHPSVLAAQITSVPRLLPRNFLLPVFAQVWKHSPHTAAHGVDYLSLLSTDTSLMAAINNRSAISLTR